MGGADPVPVGRLGVTTAAAGGGPAVAIAWFFVQLGVVATIALVAIWLGRALWRERMLREVTREHPDSAAQLRAEVRAFPLLRRIPVPADPHARTAVVVIAPLGDGRPGESFRAPAQPTYRGGVKPDGARLDATVPLARGVTMLVWSLGRVGARWEGFELLPAKERVEAFRARDDSGMATFGPMDPVTVAGDVGWRTTMRAGDTGRMVTDTHVDHDGWAYIIGVLSQSWHARAVEALDGILGTWNWLPAVRRSD